ncbi:phosphoribosyl-ATP diphosphatase [Bacillus toyonensis]|uniref:Phosphoribosyl-ATP pyrophosphatase n=1 Tax=Bacillus toyonensis TaxID=155322 RepID=A0ABX6G4K2_9BACI|nr:MULTISPECIES: phosphoribosyl-ATP diphosphatase [Bacillus]EEL23899.1 Phosphoribosyl-ATP pyrophosphatase [Bacillus cereus Rock1-3]KNH40142.1 phosphoribosyl-ATP pyrophosphatase [Bacillus thuringiensis]KXY23126.1 phosphoribosyl-ATP pyrophosphatase [Bacillus cereus]MDH8704587.1 phosphoribosyl-ATP pyrophosphohydrolase [Stenotrophomonas sp. 1198]AHA09925.1 Phosphoribosyl-ATP pyrophosphatase [Bacillus toyonensis BCT-7112]
MEDVLKLLFETIEDRKENPVPESYTNYLFSKGEDKILKKIGEECSEVIIASKNNDKKELVKEMVDVFYHCFVLLTEKNISLEDVMEEVKERNGKLSRVGERKEIDTL